VKGNEENNWGLTENIFSLLAYLIIGQKHIKWGPNIYERAACQ
jgi:hypothetical protein